MNSSKLSIPFILAVCLSAGSLARAQSTQWELGAHWGSATLHPDQIAIEPFAKGKKKNFAAANPSAFVISKSPGFADVSQFTVTSSKDGKSTEVKVTAVTTDAGGSPADHAMSLRVSMEKPPEDGRTYTISWNPGALTLEPPSGVSVTNLDGPLTVQGKISTHNAFAHPHPDNDLSLKQGDKAGTRTFHYFHDWSSIEVLNDGTADGVRRATSLERDIHFNLKADGAFESAKKGDYFDRIEAELGGYAEKVFYKDQPSLLGWGIVEFGASSKMQADQEFNVIDQTIGANAYILLHNEFWDSIGSLLCYHGEHGGDNPFPAPLISFGFDYVAHVRKDGSKAEAGQNRLTAGFYWNLPVLRKVDLEGIPLLDQISGVDFVTDVSAIYDLDKSKLSPEVHVSLDLLLSSSEKMPTISLSWVNGKTAPKFEQFDSFLAGFKMKF
jgi:hypothetical protein